MEQSNSQPRILILYTETRGTHINTAKAIIEAIKHQTQTNCSVTLVDVWKYAKFPLKFLPRMIFWFRERRPVSRWHIQNSHSQKRLLWFTFLARPYLQKVIPQIFAEHPCDLIVSVHPITSVPILEVMADEHQIPFWVVVTDIATRNVFWFDTRTSMTIVPTVKALSFASQVGIPYSKLCLLGVPVSTAYCVKPASKEEICVELGIDPSKPIVMIAGGKNGVGPVDIVAQQVDERFNEINILVLSGRNSSLKQHLSEYNWRNTTRVFGYVNDLWRLMWIADVMITKAGTGMLAEALNVGLPMVLFHRVPYLEDANVSFLVEQGAALWAPTPKMAVNALSRWLENPIELQNAKEICHRLARPDAAATVARMITTQAEDHFNGNYDDDSQRKNN